METEEASDLEPQQYQKLYWEEDVPLTDVRKSVWRKFVYLGSGLCLLFFTTGFLVRFPDQIELPFVLKNSYAEQIYRFPYPVYVTEKYIKPQDVVLEKQRLVRVTSPEIVALINKYQEAEQNLRNFSALKLLAIQKQKELLSNRIAQNNNHIRKVQKDLVILENTWKSNLAAARYENEAALEKYQIMHHLYREQASYKFELMDYEAKKNLAADALESARQNYEKSRFDLVTLNQQYQLDNRSAEKELQKLDLDVKYDSAYLHSQYVLTKSALENTYGEFELAGGDLILKASQHGIASYIFDGDKEVAAGGILLKVIPRSYHLYAWVKSPPSRIGRLAVNKKVKLKLASFPFYEWGTMSGHIENVSLSPDEQGHYSVRIAIDDFGKLKDLVRIGMNGDATIILEERTFYYYFFRSVKEVYHEATRQ